MLTFAAIRPKTVVANVTAIAGPLRDVHLTGALPAQRGALHGAGGAGGVAVAG